MYVASKGGFMETFDIAIYGLGVMGSNLAKNMLSKGFKVAVYSKSDKERKEFYLEGKEDKYLICKTEEEMLSVLTHPKKIFLMITAGKPVDSVIERLLPSLNKGDIIIDGGNSHFKDTARRYEYLIEKEIYYVGVGISGGEKGALVGPSLMVGGSKEGWESCKHILTKIAAQADGKSCCAYIAPKGAGHYVKMVHNGIEYSILQLIAEIYHVMKHGLNLEHIEITNIFKQWKKSELESYLIDISISVLEKIDEDGTPLVEKILDVAEQNGTGEWTLEEAIARGVYMPTLFESVFARNFSCNKEIRVAGAKKLTCTGQSMDIDDYEEKLRQSLFAGIIISYAQGIDLIVKASENNFWNIDLAQLMSLWGAGCIIRSKLLSQVKEAVSEKNKNLILSEEFAYISNLEPALRETVTKVQRAGIAIPGLTATLNYYDYFRADKMPINFIQALRDCFGAHTYKRIDKEGYFHTNWES